MKMPDSIDQINKKYKILVVDDMVFTIEVIIGYLSEKDGKYEVFQATNGEMAIRVAEKKLPDLIIMDWEMPVMNGLDAIRILKQKKATKEIPVIMATALTSSESLKKALAVGASDYVRKPIDKVELLARISTAIELSESYKKIKNYIGTLEKQKAEIEGQKKEISIQAEHLRKVNQQLIELDDFKEGLTGMLVHDLKNPLNTIIGLSEQGSIINMAGYQMLTMVMNILDVQKYEKKQIPLELGNYAVLDIAKNAISQVDLLRETKSIELENTIPRNCNVLVDRELMQRVFVNFLANAIKFTPNNGQITLDAGLTDEIKSINFDLEKYEILSITDSGPGIPQDKIHGVFDKFNQVIAKKSGKTRSTGLGLTFCKMVIEAHGGQIGVISDTNKGTTFWFTVKKSKVLIEIENKGNKGKDREELNLTSLDVDLLLPVLEQLQRCEVYDISAIKEIMKQVDELETSDTIKKWKEQLKFAITSCNESKYNELVLRGITQL